MSLEPIISAKTGSMADPRWKDLYRIGGISSILIAMMVTLAIAAYFIWPFKPGFTSTINILTTLRNDLIGGLFSLDLFMLLIAPVNLLVLLAMYAALKQVNESYALIALAFGMVAIAVLIPSRPLAELVLLSDKLAGAQSEAERLQYLAAGEGLHALFNGSAWLVQTVFLLINGLINSLLMLRSPAFGKMTAYTGIAVSVVGFGFVIPAVGTLFLFANTVLSIVWFGFVARDFLFHPRIK